jgi:hypothetical protein
MDPGTGLNPGTDTGAGLGSGEGTNVETAREVVGEARLGLYDEPGSQAMAGHGITSMISPGQHAILDYGVAATFFAAGFTLRSRHRAASRLAFINGAMVLGMSLLTDYPGGAWRTLSFKGHRTGDIGQAALAGLGPVLFGFAGDPEARFFYGQALSEVGVIATTDWNAAA